MGPQNNGGGTNADLVNYLQANTQPGSYLLAVGQANEAAGYILETGRPVLTLGGFLGQYDEVSVDQFAGLVQTGQLRFVMGSDLGRHQTISTWVQQNCHLVDSAQWAGTTVTNQTNGGQDSSRSTLYDCGK
jgi:4-amino-4-deoxy-L-arabinose transferase-like glycosyltransferase